MTFHYTDTAAHSPTTTAIKRVTIVINAALTGTITVADASGAVKAIITNPAVGNSFSYMDLVGVTVTASAIGDYSIVLDGSYGGR